MDKIKVVLFILTPELQLDEQLCIEVDNPEDIRKHARAYVVKYAISKQVQNLGVGALFIDSKYEGRLFYKFSTTLSKKESYFPGNPSYIVKFMTYINGRILNYYHEPAQRRSKHFCV